MHDGFDEGPRQWGSIVVEDGIEVCDAVLEDERDAVCL